MVKRTFGQVLVETRKRAGLTQKELAGCLRRGDGRPVAPSYLNAVEDNKLNPPEDAVIEQLTRILCIPADILYHHANQGTRQIGGRVATGNHFPEAPTDLPSTLAS